VQSSDAFARAIGYPRSPIDDLLVFHVVFGKTVADISLNAIANLGYAEGRFLAPVYPGDTLNAVSEVIGLRRIRVAKPASSSRARPAASRTAARC
jgi:2-methylfumaryl-CoA hydratase